MPCQQVKRFHLLSTLTQTHKYAHKLASVRKIADHFKIPPREQIQTHWFYFYICNSNHSISFLSCHDAYSVPLLSCPSLSILYQQFQTYPHLLYLVKWHWKWWHTQLYIPINYLLNASNPISLYKIQSKSKRRNLVFHNWTNCMFFQLFGIHYSVR